MQYDRQIESLGYVLEQIQTDAQSHILQIYTETRTRYYKFYKFVYKIHRSEKAWTCVCAFIAAVPDHN